MTARPIYLHGPDCWRPTAWRLPWWRAPVPKAVALDEAKIRDLQLSMYASSSVPGVFQPVDAVRQLGADVVIAVDISNKARGKMPDGLLAGMAGLDGDCAAP